jgi:hypothetical protein
MYYLASVINFCQDYHIICYCRIKLSICVCLLMSLNVHTNLKYKKLLQIDYQHIIHIQIMTEHSEEVCNTSNHHCLTPIFVLQAKDLHCVFSLLINCASQSKTPIPIYTNCVIVNCPFVIDYFYIHCKDPWNVTK